VCRGRTGTLRTPFDLAAPIVHRVLMSGLAGICHFDDRRLDPAMLMKVAGPIA
jgi:hypothetical protein